MRYNAGTADIAVVGAGHAGIEAALACARLGLDTVLFTTNLDSVANMPCNPAIGGTGKGQLVYEIDALGGEMGYAADKVTLQSRILNLGKGPAVHSKRVQADRASYKIIMKQALENQPNLRLIQAEITGIAAESGKLSSVITALGGVWNVKAAIICSGTFLKSSIIIGETSVRSGPDGMMPADSLAASLSEHGITLQRFKTGTPARIHRDTIDFSRLEIQQGDEYIIPYSSMTDEGELNKITQIPCYITYTNAKTHEIILQNLHRSPMYSGRIAGTGTRYCPSIEDKVVRFADKERHQLFLEPMGQNTKEMYLQGFSSSLPEEIQQEMLETLDGFENAHVMRPAYAIEYESIDPLQLYPTLEFKQIPGLYGAGQFNGTSGYEEAAAQGLVAGINAALKIKGEEPLILPRSGSYIGTLIDDLVVKGTREPYRMMTSRSEYRLLLRQDNADERLCGEGYRVGLLSEQRYNSFAEKQANIEREIKRAGKTHFQPSETLNAILRENGTTEVSTGVSLADLLRRPQLNYQKLAEIDSERTKLSRAERDAAEIAIKYDGYVKRQMTAVAKTARTEGKPLPAELDYPSIRGLRIEAQQKLAAIKPLTVGQASRISGVSPADIAVLLIYLARRGAAEDCET